MPLDSLSLLELFNSYKSWVSKNPNTLGDWESSVKWISYFIAGRINNSHVVSELIYCLSNLLIMSNDMIIKNAQHLDKSNSTEKIKLWLTVVEYSEVFCELSATKLWGKKGKWMLVVCIQIFKCIARLHLVYNHKEPIIESPPIPVLNRKNISEQNCNVHSDFESVSFTLKRSGKVVRKIDSSPPIALRDWKPLPKTSAFACEQTEISKKVINKQEIIAETIYIAKPIIHLASIACFGSKSWKQWMTSFILDITSLELYRSYSNKTSKAFTTQQRQQISKRSFLLLLYLLRSPMYDKHSKDRVKSFLMTLSKLPLAGIICTPLAQYLPFWQSTYFYMWSS